MPVRYIKEIEGNLSIGLPSSISNAFVVERGDIFVCEFKRHFGKKKNLIQGINETVETPVSVGYNITQYFSLIEHNLTKKYGFRVGEYLEVIFKELKRTERWREGIIFPKTKTKTKTIAIFPERLVEDLDFIPNG